ncbi:hypothetical protein ACIRPR_15915 [Streptomyces griseoflavus]|uniref:hypothetical protein n=1 Tax=Streptomyces griseoflavus TaxID=35619 RepID=UPI00198E112D|nr:hypothetical protein [Streptomyces griseoflavus]GGV43557.1 hypothetical protein GCM10010293_50230 [Streptomyces griseoflavus]
MLTKIATATASKSLAPSHTNEGCVISPSLAGLSVHTHRDRVAFQDPVHAGSRAAGSDHRAELDEREEMLAKELAEV